MRSGTTAGDASDTRMPVEPVPAPKDRDPDEQRSRMATPLFSPTDSIDRPTNQVAIRFLRADAAVLPSRGPTTGPHRRPDLLGLTRAPFQSPPLHRRRYRKRRLSQT